MGFGGRMDWLGEPPPGPMGQQRICASLVNEHHYNTRDPMESDTFSSFAGDLGDLVREEHQSFQSAGVIGPDCHGEVKE
jgi:hypothetical protein